jgi:hypothetical protein
MTVTEIFLCGVTNGVFLAGMSGREKISRIEIREPVMVSVNICGLLHEEESA